MNIVLCIYAYFGIGILSLWVSIATDIFFRPEMFSDAVLICFLLWPVHWFMVLGIQVTSLVRFKKKDR